MEEGAGRGSLHTSREQEPASARAWRCGAFTAAPPSAPRGAQPVLYGGAHILLKPSQLHHPQPTGVPAMRAHQTPVPSWVTRPIICVPQHLRAIRSRPQPWNQVCSASCRTPHLSPISTQSHRERATHSPQPWNQARSASCHTPHLSPISTVPFESSGARGLGVVGEGVVGFLTASLQKMGVQQVDHIKQRARHASSYLPMQAAGLWTFNGLHKHILAVVARSFVVMPGRAHAH